jgi:hypothetical protein
MKLTHYPELIGISARGNARRSVKQLRHCNIKVRDRSFLSSFHAVYLPSTEREAGYLDTKESEHPIGHHAREPEIFRRSVNACILSRERSAVTVCCAASKSASG